MSKWPLPIAVGDNYRAYRLVGTTTDLFERVEYAPGKRLPLSAPGRAFHDDANEAVVGSFAAQTAGAERGGHVSIRFTD